MAETETKTPSEAEQRAANKAKLNKLERLDEANPPAGMASTTTTAGAPKPVPTAPHAEGFRQAQPRDRTILWEGNARVCHDIICRGVTPEHVLDPRYLWQLQHKLNRFDEVLLHDEAFRWEIRARVMRKNSELQLVFIDPIMAPVRHEVVIDPKLDFAAITVEHRGAVDKWTVIRGNVKLRTGFETLEEAEEWVRQRKAAA